MRLLLLQEILDDLENDDNENECGVCDNEREKHSSDESEVADEINLNKAKPENVTAQEVRHENREGGHTYCYCYYHSFALHTCREALLIKHLLLTCTAHPITTVYNRYAISQSRVHGTCCRNVYYH